MGERPLIDLEAMVAVSCLIMWWTVGYLSSFIKFAVDASKLLLVTILQAQFCNFCSINIPEWGVKGI